MIDQDDLHQNISGNNPRSSRIYQLYVDVNELLAPSSSQGLLEHDRVRKLQLLFDSYRPCFLNPLDYPPKNDASRQKLEQGRVTLKQGSVQLDDSLKKEAKELSDSIGVNEEMCAQWIANATDLQHQLEADRKGVAEFVYFSDRNHFLQVLLTLIKLCGDDRLPEQLVFLGQSLIFELVASDLCRSLYRLARDTMRRAEDFSHHQHFYYQDLKLIVECIFYLHYTIATDDDHAYAIELFNLLDFCIDCSRRTPRSNDIFRTTYIVIFTLVHFFNPSTEVLDRNGDLLDCRFPPDFNKRREFGALQNRFRQSLSQINSRYTIVWLAWALFLQSFEPVDHLNQDIETFLKPVAESASPFPALATVLESHSFRQDAENSLIFVSVVDQLIALFITRVPHFISNVKTNEAFALRQHRQERKPARRGGPEHSHAALTTMFPDLLRLISSIYSYQPHEADKFLQEDSEFHHFLTLSMPPEHTPSAVWFCAFMEMIGALGVHESCAQKAFEFLMATPNRYVNLNQVMLNIRDIHFKLTSDPSLSQGVLSEEVENRMVAVFALLQRLMKNCSVIRFQTACNKEWDLFQLLFGLFLGGRISPYLKSEILNTIAGFARSRELTSPVWTWIDRSQLLVTSDSSSWSSTTTTLMMTSSSSSSSTPSFRTDFENECAMQEYPLTISFLKLLLKLIGNFDLSTPSTSTTNNRNKLLPYLTFIRDDIFLRLDTLDFRQEGDRWHIASYCLRIFIYILESYEPAADRDCSSFGYHTMSYFLGHSNRMLRLISWMLAKLEIDLPEERMKADGDKFERAALLSLRLLEVALRQEDAFLLFMRSLPVPELLTPIHKYLETEGPTIVTIAKYVLYAENARIPLFSVLVIYLLSRKQGNIARILAMSEDAPRLMLGYQEKLEAPEFLDDVEQDDEAGTWTDNFTPPENMGNDADAETTVDADCKARRMAKHSIKHAIVRLLLDNVAPRGYNLAHFFLGFAESVPFDMTDLGARNSLSCLQTVITTLDSLTPSFAATHPIFVEACYELVYRLCADPRTSTAVLRELRRPSPGDQSTRYFFQRQLRQCTKAIGRISSPNRQSELTVYQLNTWGWLLKSVALELHTSNLLEQRAPSHILLDLLFLNSASDIEPLGVDLGHTTLDDPHAEWTDVDHQTRILMLQLLDPVDYEIPDPPLLQGLRSGPFQNIDFDACRTTSAKGVQSIDIRQLYESLIVKCEESERGQGAKSRARIQSLRESIKEVLQLAMKQNSCMETFTAKREYLEAWRQILGVALSRNCFRYLERFDSTWLFDFLEILLDKLGSKNVLNPLAEIISTAVLMLMYKLTELKLASAKPLTRRTTTGAHHHQHQASAFDAEYLPVDQLQKILTGIVRSILRPGATQTLRGNLYGALLNYLKFTQQDAAAPVLVNGLAHSSDILRQAEQHENNQRRLDMGNRRIINSVGTKFLDALCSDVTDGTERLQATAYATFDALMSYDSDHKWLDFIVKHGYLRSFIDRLQKTDEHIQQVFAASDVRSLKYVAIFEAHISFFLKICQHMHGAGVLLRNGLLQKLTDCQFLDQRPEDAAATEGYSTMTSSLDASTLLPSSTQRYQQLLNPILRLIVCLLSSLPKNKTAASEVCEFLRAHAELVSSVLQDRSPITKSSLIELELLTSIFMHLARHDELIKEKLQRQAVNFQNLLLHLFAKYSSDRWIDSTGSSSSSSSSGSASSSATSPSSKRAIVATASSSSLRGQEEQLIARGICKNLIAYCRILTQFPPSTTAVSAADDDYEPFDGEDRERAQHELNTFQQRRLLSGLSVQLSWALFTPTIAEDLSDSRTGPLHGKLPALAVLVQYLKTTVHQLSKARSDLEVHTDKFDNCDGLSRHALLELTTNVFDDSGEAVEIPALKHNAQLHLAEVIAQTEQQIENAEYAIENALWVLWRHLNFYLKQIPSVPIETQASSSSSFGKPLKFFFGPREKQILVREAAAALDSTLHTIYKHQTQAPTKRSLVLQFVPRIQDLLRGARSR